MHNLLVATMALALLSGVGCTNKEIEVRLQAQETELKQLKAEVAELKEKQRSAPEHHYELRNAGFRTFRFDSATGDTCIQLTTPDDWKRKETKSQSCGCTDASERWA